MTREPSLVLSNLALCIVREDERLGEKTLLLDTLRIEITHIFSNHGEFSPTASQNLMLRSNF